MPDVIIFTPKAKVEPTPDAEHVTIIVRDGKPEKWFEFAVSFQIDDSEFEFKIWALDMADAERRVQAIRSTAKLDGQLFATVMA